MTSSTTIVLPFTIGSTATFTVSPTSSQSAFIVGNYVIISNTITPTNFIYGYVTSFSGTTLQVNVLFSSGSGTYNSWKFTVSTPSVSTPSGGSFSTTLNSTALSNSTPTSATLTQTISTTTSTVKYLIIAQIITQTNVASQVIYGTIGRQSGSSATNSATNLANGSSTISSGLTAQNNHMSIMTLAATSIYDRMYMSVIDTPGSGNNIYSFWVQSALSSAILTSPNASLSVIQLTP